MVTPKISIIIPIYNSSNYLTKCIDSVRSQSYTNLEIILVNDGSTDNSIDMCNDFAEKDERIIIIDKTNGGVASARNHGLDKATGDYIGFVDSDDYIASQMYEELLEAAITHEADIAECGYFIIDANTETKKKFSLKEEVVEGNHLCSYRYLSKINTTNYNVNKLYKRFLFEELRYKDLAYSEDFCLNAIAFYECNKKVTISGCYYYYFQNVNSACKKPFSKPKFDIIQAGKEIYKFHELRFTDLCPTVAVYIVSNILACYYELFFSNQCSEKEYRKLLIDDFRSYYPIAKKSNFINVKRMRMSMRLFAISPSTYCHFKKVISAIRK